MSDLLKITIEHFPKCFLHQFATLKLYFECSRTHQARNIDQPSTLLLAGYIDTESPLSPIFSVALRHKSRHNETDGDAFFQSQPSNAYWGVS